MTEQITDLMRNTTNIPSYCVMRRVQKIQNTPKNYIKKIHYKNTQKITSKKNTSKIQKNYI